jgi:hypothetical protein
MLRRGMHLCPRLPSCVAQQSGPYSIMANHAPSDACRISHKNHESLQKKECWENEMGIKFVTIRKSTTQWWFLIVTELLSCTNRASKISLNSAVQMSNKNSHGQPFILHFRRKHRPNSIYSSQLPFRRGMDGSSWIHLKEEPWTGSSYIRIRCC